jgi:hypothetical protein
LYSWGWVDSVPDPLLLRTSGSPWNRTRDLWICNQELWPQDHRGGILKLKADNYLERFFFFRLNIQRENLYAYFCFFFNVASSSMIRAFFGISSFLVEIFCAFISVYTRRVQKEQTPWRVFASELYRPSDRSLSAKLVPTFADRSVSCCESSEFLTAVMSVF